ncbi:hypothetical protein COCMIDRAFT_41160 [Bipolaris oryzae ATCC 44560]|uniref:Major facilitator superfamily (MFS) profile domain-containing protein n=1 Tax=Bipolaris oryzae ATCC 44560 TaxID=930090 RepID=W6YSC8_COCMI|nr:uncharacterized protein COCMIDRAFT_41160 [Bipolaris oryzae ATCC 44560]EUC40525.1 hypothetical protein COCMIDRAFT_41160 [Bipolaris oryzae ATCC 44560]
MLAEASSNVRLEKDTAAGLERDRDTHPLQWSYRKKWTTTSIVAGFTFISTSSSSMMAPAIPEISRDVGATKSAEQQLILSAFVIAYAAGPLFLAPLSEVYGRSIILHITAWFYLTWNLCCGFASTPSQMVVFRLLAGLGASAPLSIGGGVLSDIWVAEERGKAMGIYSMMPLLGPALGPFIGGFVTQYANWRWIFWGKSIFDAVIQVTALVSLHETYPPAILKRTARKEQQSEAKFPNESHQSPGQSITQVLRTALARPLRLLGTEVIVQVLSIYLAFLFGTQYLMLSTFTTLWTKKYNQSMAKSGLHFLALGLGYLFGAQCCAFVSDKIYVRMKMRNNSAGRPEFRVPMMAPGALLVPVGLFLYGWSAQAHFHWIVPDIGAFIFGAGCIFGTQTIQVYLVDTYSRYAASALAAASVLRFVAGFVFPLFAPDLFRALEYGWGNSLLGGIAIAFGIPGPLLVWKYGEKLRSLSRFAAN